jgi:hypothetical protein
MPKAALIGLLGGVLLAGCVVPLHSASSSKHLLTAKERLQILRRAQIWKPTDVPSMDIMNGPRGGFAPGETVTCRYNDKKFGGNTPKFGCVIDGKKDDVLKVRYGRDNGEAYASVAATRLLWALGYGADSMYPVHVVCEGCPQKKMAREGTVQGDAVVFDIATIEKKFPGRDVDARNAPIGWEWPEIDFVDPSVGGASRDERDALKLLAVLLQHTDNKGEQQRLVCLDPKGSDESDDTCADPFMMIHDLGQTFGSANLFNRSALSSVNYERWASTPIWRDAAKCVGDLAPSERGTLPDPVISEGGRKFLADLLVQLTDDQIRDLFTVARFADKPHGGAPVEDWVSVFNRKRDEIVSAHCP